LRTPSPNTRQDQEIQALPEKCNQRLNTDPTEDWEQKAKELEELKDQYYEEKELLNVEKQNLLLEKITYSKSLGELKENHDRLKEELDGKNTKYKKLKQEFQRMKFEFENKDEGYRRMEEQISLLQQKQEESEVRAKKFESSWKQQTREVEHL